MTGTARYLANAVSMAGQSVVQKVAGFVSTIILAQTLHAQGLGIVAITSNTAGTFYGVARLGTDAAVHVLTAETNTSKDAEVVSEILSHALVLFLIIALTTALACYLLADRIADGLFGNPTLQHFVQLAAALLFLQVVAQFAYTVFAGLHAFTHYARITIFTAPISAGLTIAGAYEAGAMGAALGLIAGQAVLTVALLHRLWRVCRDQNIKFRPSLSATRFHQILAIGFPFYAAGLLSIPAEYVIQAVLVRAHSVSVMGDLRVISAITSVITTLPSFLSGPMISEFANARTRSETNYISFVLLNARVILLGGVLAMTVLGIFWRNIVLLGFGSSYSGAMEVGYIALLTAVLMCMQTVLANSLLASKSTTIYFLWNTATTLLFVAAAVLLVPRYGLGGYLVAQSLSTSAAIIYMTIRLVYQKEACSGDASALAIALALTAASFVVVGIANAEAWEFLTKLLAVGAAVWALALLWLRYVFKRAELVAIGLRSELVATFLNFLGARLIGPD